MINLRVSKRYAKALLNLAKDENLLRVAYGDMYNVNKTILLNKELRLLLKSPIINADLKIKILKSIFYQKISDLSMSFIETIAKKGREGLLYEISASFIKLYKNYNNIESAEIITPQPIDDEIRRDVIDFIAQNSGKEVELTEKIDESIIGGAIINMGDKQLDASVSSSLKALKLEFSKNLYIQDY